MYCISFPRSSLGVDYGRVGKSGLYKKTKSDINDCGVNGGRSYNASSLLGCQRDQKRQNDDLTEETKYDFNQEHPTNPTVEGLPEPTSRLFPFENEKRHQKMNKPKSLNSLSRSGGFQKYHENLQSQGARRRQRSERSEEKKDDYLDFASLTKSEPNDNPGWVKFPAFCDTRELSIFPDEFIQNKCTDNLSSNEMSIAQSDQRLRNELEKSHRMLEVERNKNLGLQNKLQDLEFKLQSMEGKLKIIEESQSVEGFSRQMQKLEDQVAFYRREYQGERKKRENCEDRLLQTRQEKRAYEEQMDCLIFEYIPNISPKFKDIGPVDYEINESFDSVGFYQLGEKLGEGYYGSVRIGSHTQTQKKFGIKILNKANILRFKDLKQIAEEIHVLQTYRHPNIIHLEEVIHSGENIYMVTELCFMDLHKYHSEIGLSLESARQVVYGILQPLYHLHRHGICHLDLKPENILLSKSLDSHNASHQHVRICDFGLVSMAKRSDQTKNVIREAYACGTPGFYAPEMILHEKFEGRTADMWSLGCIILEITLGFTQEWLDSYDRADDNPARFQKNLESCLNEINIHEYPDHALLMDMIHGCLSIEPSQRTTSECALSHPWLKQT